VITINLMGGTGNQLFQWALGRALEARGQEVQFNRGILDSGGSRRYMLGDFGMKLNLVNTPETGQIVWEGSHKFRPEILDLKGDYSLHGYWQCEKYFEEIGDRIRDEVFKNIQIGKFTRLLGYKIKVYDSCFIHVRRSDNLSKRALEFHGLTGLDYFEKAIYQSPLYEFFVFSDDPEWCKNQTLFQNMTVISHNGWSGSSDPNGRITRRDGGRECEDLYLMSLCKHAIIANSSFSWWGAWLREEQGIVIAPKAWFVSADSDIVPERWIRA
jgi:hypothetical protein